MAKGDHKRVQDVVYDQQGRLNNNQDAVNSSLNTAQQGFQNTYNGAAQTDTQSYNSIMQKYNSFFADPRNPQSQQNQNQGIGYPSQQNGMRQDGGSGFDQINGMNQGDIKDSGNGSSDFESALREFQSSHDVNSATQDDLLNFMQSKGVNATPYMYGNTRSGNEITSPSGEKYKYRVDNGGWYNSSMDDGGGGNNNGNGSGYDRSLAAMGLGSYPGALNKAFQGYSDFADNGGYSGQDIQDLRARGTSPIRSIYSSAKANVDQARNLSGGYMPNYGALSSQMARQQSQQIGDATQNVNAGIADARNSGRLSGLGGLSGLGQFGASMSNNNANATMNARASALAGMSGLYGTQPGLLTTSGNQLNQSGQNLINSQAVANQTGGTLIGGITNSANIPGNFQTAIGNIGSAVNLGASLIKPLSAIM